MWRYNMADEIQGLIREILERVVRVETKIDDYTGLRDKVDKTHAMACESKGDIDEMKDSQKWLWRTVGGVIIATAVVALIKIM